MFPAAAVRNHRPDGFKRNKRSITVPEVLEARRPESVLAGCSHPPEALGEGPSCLSQLLELLVFLAVTSVLCNCAVSPSYRGH